MKTSPFQIIVLSFFAVSIVIGVIVLSSIKSSSQGPGATIVIWGTMPQQVFSFSTAALTQTNKNLKFNYIEMKSDTFDRDLVEALASGIGPDVILLPQDYIVRLRDKILPMPYTALPLRDFMDTFIQEGSLYLDEGGILAVPFTVDPLVMYWNRDLLTNAGMAIPPKTWNEFITLAPKLTVRDKSINVIKSTVALGEFRNIANSKEIVSALFLQTGNPIMKHDASGFGSALYPSTLGTVGAMNFYTDFANPVKPNYSWNRALPNSRDMFTAGDLVFYFGFASEISKIREKNPNLNFDVTYFPQPKSAPVLTTFGRMQGLAVLKSSPNASQAFGDILALTSAESIASVSKATNLPPVRLDLLSTSSEDPYQAIFYSSAIRAQGWLDPNPQSSRTIFQNMIESITSGEQEVGAAIDLAGRNLNGI
ncbi:MAG: extracellular solute-binding protein [Candidatus Taylorbacteria bacterium]|nr:extracellular solute-binding protein [Candidatus Taylorbacteria bacterium]